MNAKTAAEAFAATTEGKQIMEASNRVLAELVTRGEVANTREAKMAAYEVILTMTMELAAA